MKKAKYFFGVMLVLGVLFSDTGSGLYGREAFNEDLLKVFNFRNLGPYRAGAWISDIAVPESQEPEHRYTFYIAARNGGVWKTINNGTTFTPIFDDQDVNSIGAIRVAPSDPNIVWVGTGEASNARSAYAGSGIYKSSDAGKTWLCMGLKDSHHIPRIVIHPRNPDIVYLAVMGHLFSHNEERGVFKTTDGGKTWDKILYINDRVGVIDLAMDRENPEVLYAAAYDKERLPWHFEAGGPESGIYRTTDAGRTWTRLAGGLPTGKIGRIGIDIYRQDPNILYAVVENVNLRPPTDKEVKADKEKGLESQEREIGGEVYRSDDRGTTWEKMNSIEQNVGGKAAYSFNQIWVDPNNDQNVFVNTICLASSHDRGRTWHDFDWPPRHLFVNIFGDVRCFWIDANDSRHMIVGSDGGVFVSYDGGKTADHLYNLPLGEVYDVEVDMETPYSIYAGLQDHESWKGPVNSWSGQVTLEDWVIVGLWDGMYSQVDSIDSRWLYTTSQFGFHMRVDQGLGEHTSIMPKNKEGQPPYRYTWTTPILISPHNPQILYTGGQMLLRSLNRGDTWEEISPDLTRNDPVKIAGKGHIMYCTITTISESPLKPGIIWVGTDDGRLHLTKNHGASWQEFTRQITLSGCPAERWLSRVLASHHQLAAAYVAKSGYRNDDFRPFLYKTADFGTTWQDISANLPQQPISVIFEDRKNPNLLFVGNDHGVYVTIDGGQRWVRFKNNLPSVPVRDLLVHPGENDLVVGTYGRGVFVTDISPLQELNEEVLAKEVHLFAVEPKIQRNYSQRRDWGNYHMSGDRHLATANEANGFAIYYYLKHETKKPVKIFISDPYGKQLGTLEGVKSSGINLVYWDTAGNEPGEYVIILTVSKKKWTRKTRLLASPHWPIAVTK